MAHKLIFGDIKTNVQSSNHQESLVTVFRNPNYNPSNIDKDFTLLKLRSPVAINNYVRPICLAVSSQEQTIYPTGTCKAVGWGHTQWQGRFRNGGSKKIEAYYTIFKTMYVEVWLKVLTTFELVSNFNVLNADPRSEILRSFKVCFSGLFCYVIVYISTA